jgi:hypothetical protein
MVEEGLLADHPASRECEEVGPGSLESSSATQPAALDAPDEQKAVAEVEHFFRLKSHLAPFGGPPPLELEARRAAAIDGVEAELDEVGRVMNSVPGW